MALAVVAHMGIWDSILDVLILLGTAMLFGFIAERLKQSAVVGYLLAGSVVGPGALGWVGSQEHIFSIAELGVALLLFTIGLEFSPRQLWQLGRVPLIAGPLQVILTTALGTACGFAIGLSPSESLVIGGVTALSSTACVLRVLRDRVEVDSVHGRATLGILLVQDVAVIPLVLLVTALAGGGSAGSILLQMLVSISLAAVLVGAFYVVFNWVIPPLLIMPTWRRNRDLPVLLTVVIAGGAAWAAHALGLSPALGAFAAGVLLAVSPFANQIQADIQPLRSLLVTLFFSAIGMFGDFFWLLNNVGLVIAVLLAIVLGKTLVTTVAALLAGVRLRFAIATGCCLAQIGEFSFVLATIAHDAASEVALLSETTFRAIVSATILALLFTPYLVVLAPRIGNYGERLLQKLGLRKLPPMSTDEDTKSIATAGHGSTIVLGFGPAGQRLVEELLSRGQRQIIVVDLNLENVKQAKQYGLESHVGDATQTDVLIHAGLDRASNVAITIPMPTETQRLIHQIRHRNPNIRIIVRCRYHIFHWAYLAAGAHVVIDEEDHVGLKMAEAINGN